MTMNDPVSSALSSINNSEKISKLVVTVFPSSMIIKEILTVMNKNGYIGSFEEVVDSKGNRLTINLLGKINKCGAIKPRFSVTLPEYEKFEKRFLPAKDFGIIVISTNKGIMTHTEAKEKKLGGKLLAYCY
ncbi:MAG TPA: 30S ribosomal protein S8 [Candidatus Nanoarchaeia archaeon]|nr:30S ribosomal protein S8 [Candidatus Nanoarchaeia archaeon]